MHLVKMVSAALLVLSLLAGLDALLLDRFVPQGSVINPTYFTAAVSSYLALGVVALVHERAEGGARLRRAHRAAISVLRHHAHRAHDHRFR